MRAPWRLCRERIAGITCVWFDGAASTKQSDPASGWLVDQEMAHGRIRDDDDLAAVPNIVRQMNDILIEHANAAGGDSLADRLEFGIAVDAIDRIPVAFVNVERARSERIVEAGRHAAIVDAVGFELGLARDHLVWRIPAWPFALVSDMALTLPGKAVAPYADTIARGHAAFLDMVEIAVRRIDNNSPDLFGRRIVHVGAPPLFRDLRDIDFRDRILLIGHRLVHQRRDGPNRLLWDTCDIDGRYAR